MSESLRDLVVSLSLNTENFTRNIKSVNKQIQEAESYFKLAAAGVEGFENTTEGLTAKLSTLERRLSLQKDVVTQYERALAQATSRLTECYNRQNDYAQRLEQAKQRQSALRDEVQTATDAYTRYRDSLGESDSATIAAKANMEAAQQEYEAATADVNKLAGQQDALRKATQNAADAVSTQQTQLNKAQASVKETEKAIRGCNDALRLSQTNWQAAGDRMKAADTAVTFLGRQMQLAQSRFRLASAGIKDVDTNAGALSAKLVMLNEKLTLQQQTVTQYAEKLCAAREQLAAAQQVNDPEKIREATDAVTDAETALTNAQAAVRETEAAIRDTNRQLDTARSMWTAAGKSMTAFSKHCDSVSKTTGAIGRTLSTVVSAPVLALGTAAMKSGIEFESAFTGVRKTVNASEAEFAQLESAVKRMSTEIAADTTEISDVMANAGQLGIRTDALEDFTRVMIDLGNTTDIVAGEAGSTLAKFANIMGMDQGLFENLGSTLVDLGNNFATTESAIMEMALRLAGAGKQVGLSEAQILGFATALSSVGVEAQIIDSPERIPQIAAWLRGSGTVTFANRQGGFYHARVVNQISFEKVLRGNPHRSFAVNFRCQPFWCQVDVQPITLTTSGSFITNPGSVPSEPIITVYGSGDVTLMVGMTICELEGVSDSITLDTPLMEAYRGNMSMNSYLSGDFPLLEPGQNAISWTGTVSKVEIQPNWRFL